jgi:hypothetical protein
MRCKICNSEVSITETKCPKCGNGLFRLRGVRFYQPKKKGAQSYGQGIKDTVLGKLYGDLENDIKGLDLEERQAFGPIEERIQNLFTRRISDSELEALFDTEIVPPIDELSRTQKAQDVFKKVDEAIKRDLGPIAFNHYKDKGADVLKILRAGEVICLFVEGGSKAIDLSVKTFPFFKASEAACSLHMHGRYRELKNNSFIKEISEWIGDDVDKVLLVGVPEWAARRKTLLEIISGILRGNGDHLNGSLRAGIALYILGREWILKIERKDLSKAKDFQIKNLLKTKGTDEDKKDLAEKLCEIQGRRNECVHGSIEDDERTVSESRLRSYHCLRKIPEILEI